MGRKKLSEIKQTDGQASSGKEFEFTTIEQILGDKGEGKYATANVVEYEGQLNEMNLSDLQRHALKYGLLPTDNKKLLKERLVREFNKHFSQYKVPKNIVKEKEVNPSVLKIMSEGR